MIQCKCKLIVIKYQIGNGDGYKLLMLKWASVRIIVLVKVNKILQISYCLKYWCIKKLENAMTLTIK